MRKNGSLQQELDEWSQDIAQALELLVANGHCLDSLLDSPINKVLTLHALCIKRMEQQNISTMILMRNAQHSTNEQFSELIRGKP